MIRFNINSVLVGSAILLAAVGCGDASSFNPSDGETGDRFIDEAVPAAEESATREDELELACEAFCEHGSACGSRTFSADCFDRCVDVYDAESEDDACLTAQIDLLNCYSAVDCDGLPREAREECSDAVIRLQTSCESVLRRVETEEDSDLVVIEIGDREWTDADGTPEELEPAEGSDEGESDETDTSDPIFVLPEIPELDPIVELDPIFDLP